MSTRISIPASDRSTPPAALTALPSRRAAFQINRREFDSLPRPTHAAFDRLEIGFGSSGAVDEFSNINE